MANRGLEPGFMPGLELARGFYRDAVAPVLARRFAGLGYSAALIGSGSEVLGFDDEMSMDHHWGPRVMLFLEKDALEALVNEIGDALGHELPDTYEGFPTNWSAPHPEDGSRTPVGIGGGPVNHRVELHTLGSYFTDYLGLDIDSPMSAVDWLSLPWQKLRSIRAGGVFRDDLGLKEVRDRLAWYPRDVWLYVLASCWSRIGEEEHLHGRAGIAGDEVGSSIIASRLVRDVMRLGYLMERVYPPYAKWFGTAFAELECAARLRTPLGGILSARTWRERDTGLCQAYRHLAQMHNDLELTPELLSEPEPFWSRPFTVIHGDRFAEALRAEIRGEEVSAIARRRLIGSIDLVSDNTDLLEDPTRRAAMAALYGT